MAFWCTSCAVPHTFHDLFWLQSAFKSPSNPGIDHISHSGQIQNTFGLSHQGNRFGHLDAWHLMLDALQPHKPSKNCTGFHPLSCVHLIQKWVSHNKLEARYWKHFVCLAMMTTIVNFVPFRCILKKPPMFKNHEQLMILMKPWKSEISMFNPLFQVKFV